eukprot:TRINITY_DN4642_c0_g1_i6.p1 TRINITY_DN4642_c0_g1~~TRINITY_DN4642_c0_g1_i6.p1  ORF type:complete len:185 (-),score=25.20 TRINITY_DN4642_c0_g1_i6:240-794(-)
MEWAISHADASGSNRCCCSSSSCCCCCCCCCYCWLLLLLLLPCCCCCCWSRLGSGLGSRFDAMGLNLFVFFFVNWVDLAKSSSLVTASLNSTTQSDKERPAGGEDLEVAGYPSDAATLSDFMLLALLGSATVGFAAEQVSQRRGNRYGKRAIVLNRGKEVASSKESSNALSEEEVANLYRRFMD